MDTVHDVPSGAGIIVVYLSPERNVVERQRESSSAVTHPKIVIDYIVYLYYNHNIRISDNK